MLTFIHHFKTWKPLAFLLIMAQGACTKFVQIGPPTTAIASSTVYDNNTSAAAAMTSIYSNMISSNSSNLSGGQGSLSYLLSLAADEMKNYASVSVVNTQFYSNALKSSSTNGASNYYFWQELYNEIYVSNAILSGLQNSKGVSASIRDQITGEAKFMRAFLYFYAVNLYGDVPLVNSTDYRVNNTIHRSSVTDVYQQIINDLKDAQAKLGTDFLNASGTVTTERVRPNKGAATALLARAYLYTADWVNAEASANAVINNTNYSLDSTLDDVFLKNSTEAIWQLQSINTGYNTFDGYDFILTSPPGSGRFKVSLSPILMNVFETGDARSTYWVSAYSKDNVTYYYPYKYKIGVYNTSLEITEYTMVLRLAEQYLIRAEARAQQNKISDALADLNAIRARAQLPNSSANDKESLLMAIYHERQTELFTEWGQRWFDLKRTGMINTVMSVVTPQKGGTWQPEWALLPLPLAETMINPNLKQNPGYN